MSRSMSTAHQRFRSSSRLLCFPLTTADFSQQTAPTASNALRAQVVEGRLVVRGPRERISGKTERGETRRAMSPPPRYSIPPLAVRLLMLLFLNNFTRCVYHRVNDAAELSATAVDLGRVFGFLRNGSSGWVNRSMEL